ncbi:tannase and feruloyl esterase [Colletotrichum eremochloae]|nr:tannase and feruloyl esterase [Colletotrichum eremochloae]
MFVASVLPLFVILGLGAPALAAFQDDCLALTPEAAVANSTGKTLEFVTSGTKLSFPEQDASCNRASQVVRADVCRVAMNITTSDRSEVAAEVWMPKDWNGRLVTVAGGGLDGCIHYEDMAYATANGFAVVGTNNGHAGTAGFQFLDNEDVVIDFSWRAIHVGVVAGRQLLQPLYDRGATRSYFLGCSLGGRQGIKAADMFPDDFDGIVAGAPAVDFNNLYSFRASFFPRTGAVGSEDFITPEVWKTTIHDEVLRQCDKIDGVEDGIIEDPTLCQFDAGTLLCQDDSAADDSTDCLSSKQVDIVRSIFSPTIDAQGNLFWPGMNPGSEVVSADGLYNGKPWALSQNWFRYAVYNDPSWDAATFTLEKDATFADRKNPGDIRSNPDDLSTFKDRGGKLLMFHGQQDQQITSFHTPIFYDRLSQGMGLDQAGMDGFARFFRISGMNHCSTGPGAWVLGQGGGAGDAAFADSLPFDASHNVLAAIVDWVEIGVAPETITGTKFVNDTADLGIDFQRRHCKYPLRNTYKGGGLDPKSVDSWTCT